MIAYFPIAPTSEIEKRVMLVRTEMFVRTAVESRKATNGVSSLSENRFARQMSSTLSRG